MDDVLQGGGAYGSFGYHSATVADSEGRTPSAGAAPAHDRHHRKKLLNQSRAFRRDAAIYQGMIGMGRRGIVGTGATISVRPDEDQPSDDLRAWCDEVEADWRAWWRKPDVRGRLSGRRLEGLVCEELLTCGDVGVVLVSDDGALALQVVEAEQIDGGAKAEDGIEQDKWGRPLRYFVAPYDPRSGALRLQDAQPYEPKDFLLVGTCDRASSTRGIPPNQAGFPNIHRVNDISDSEALGWQMRARIALVVTRLNGGPLASDVDILNPRRAGNDRAATGIVELDKALIYYAKPGEDAKAMDRKDLGSSFAESFYALVRPLGLPMGLPLELLVLDWTKSNYSQMRAVLAICQDAVLGWQVLLEDQFYRPVFEWWLAKKIERKQIRPAPGAYAAEWIMPSFPWISILEEAQAWGEKIDRGLASWSEAIKSQNKDPDAVRAQIERDEIEAYKAAQRVATATGRKVDETPVSPLVFRGMKLPPNGLPPAAKPAAAPAPEPTAPPPAPQKAAA